VDSSTDAGIYTHTCIHINMIHIHTYIYIYMHTHTHTYIHIHVGGGVEYRCGELGRWRGNERGLGFSGGGGAVGLDIAFAVAGAQVCVGCQKIVCNWCVYLVGGRCHWCVYLVCVGCILCV